jgi:sugar diacid utilization regulator
VIEGRLGALGLVSVREPYYLIYVDILPAMKENVDYVRSKLKESMPDLFTVFYEDSLLIIGNISDEKYAPTIEKLKQFFELYYLYACISNPFRSLAELKQQYSLGRQGCSVGQKLYPDTHFFEFQHLNLYCLLQEAAENFSLQDYLHPGIRILKAYDQENTTDYCKTLIVYLENNLNILATANQLFIHRNTLSYRLRKISQLLNASLEDKNICLNLLLANLYDNLLTGSERENHQAA